MLTVILSISWLCDANFYRLQFALALWRRPATVAIDSTGAHRAPLQKMCNYMLKLV
jgi:hypothetical protein